MPDFEGIVMAHPPFNLLFILLLGLMIQHCGNSKSRMEFYVYDLFINNELVDLTL